MAPSIQEVISGLNPEEQRIADYIIKATQVANEKEEMEKLYNGLSTYKQNQLFLYIGKRIINGTQ